MLTTLSMFPQGYVCSMRQNRMAEIPEWYLQIYFQRRRLEQIEPTPEIADRGRTDKPNMAIEGNLGCSAETP